MYLHEYQSKLLFARVGIPILPGRTATSAQEALVITQDFGVPIIVNAQTLSNTRVFRRAETPEEAQAVAQDILDMTIAGVRVRLVLIEPAVETLSESFLGIFGNRGSSLIMFASTEAGKDLNEIERAHAGEVYRETIDPFRGVLGFQARNLASSINLPRETWADFTEISKNLYRCALESDAVRVEINPLGLTPEGRLIALGGRLVLDDNALFRQPELAAMRDIQAEHDSAVQARASDIRYIRLNGKTGCIVSGAGLGMATMDLLAKYGAPAASFLDLGSDIHRDKVIGALRLIMPDAETILFNIFADKAPCPEIAEELLAAIVETQPTVPLVIRLSGHDALAGENVLNAANLTNFGTARTTTEAVQWITSAVAKA